MTTTIRELDNFCRLYNASIRYDRRKDLRGFRTFDYALNNGKKTKR